MTNLAVIYYSSTATVDAMARRCAEAGERLGARVRLRHVEELAPEKAIAANPDWQAHRDEVRDEPVATSDDIVWADAVLLGTPTRYGNVASQLKQFIDTLGPQWQQGELADKAYAGFTSTATQHGGQESTLLALYNIIYHFGGVIVPPGYTDQLKFTDGNPYGVGQVTGGSGTGTVGESELAALDHLTERVLKVAGALKAAEPLEAEEAREVRDDATVG